MYCGQKISLVEQSQSEPERAINDSLVSPVTIITDPSTDSIVALGINEKTANWDYSKTPVLQAI